MLLSVCFVVIAYLMGSLSSAIIICKLMGLPDPRSQGSGNPGATNVLRFGGKKLAIIVLLGDALKGVIPVLIAKLLGVPYAALAYIALAVFLGHLFPVFFGFRGGKGVATAVGVLVVLSWPVAVFAIAVWILMAAIFRYSSLAALTAALLVPVLAYFVSEAHAFFAITLISLILIARHYENIKRLLVGTEGKIGAKKASL